ncbi:restriction endonuclease subunit S [Planctellipticum variicoloris]|uniref:restriction endonuclease subunit S n=1 Tax=Planctellipticum variicoloris TaxID=3064265 RepID=UPI003013F522|nr:restriction endonuclease subunit S [Planctomycetaceae bacterium SH412]
MKRVPVSEAAEVNPRMPSELRSGADFAASFVGMADVSERGFVVAYQPRPLSELLKGYTFFRRGDVLSAKITPCMQNGKAAVTDNMPTEFGFGSTEFHVLRAKPHTDPRYLFHMIWSPFFRQSAESSFTGTGGQQRVPTDFFGRFEIPLPPLPEQRRIAAILDQADGVRRKRQAALALTDQFLRSTFLEMFGDPALNSKNWPLVKINDVLDESRGGVRCGPFGTALQKSEYTSSGIPVWGIDNIKPDDFVENGCLYIAPSKYPALDAYRVDQGDILISRAGTVGRMCVATPSSSHSIIGTNLIRMTLNRGIVVPEYVAALFTFFPDRVARLRANAKPDAYSFMKTGELRDTSIQLPSFEKQKQFRAVKSFTGGTKQKMVDGLDAANRAFDSLVYRAFRGEL